jgi:hypothetical protein
MGDAVSIKINQKGGDYAKRRQNRANWSRPENRKTNGILYRP